MAISPVFISSSFDPLVKSAHSWTAMNLKVDLLIGDAFERQAGGMDEVPTEDQCQFLFGVLFGFFNLFRGHGQIKVLGLLVHFLKPTLEIPAFYLVPGLWVYLFQRVILLV